MCLTGLAYEFSSSHHSAWLCAGNLLLGASQAVVLGQPLPCGALQMHGFDGVQLCNGAACTAGFLQLPAVSGRATNVWVPVGQPTPLLDLGLEEAGLSSVSLVLCHQESAQTRQRSILLCKDAMEVAGDTHTVEIKKEVCNILVPLFFHLHDEDQSVAQVGISKLHGHWRKQVLTALRMAWALAAPSAGDGGWPMPLPERRTDTFPQLLHLPSHQSPGKPRAVARCRTHRPCLAGTEGISWSLFLCRPPGKPFFVRPSC